MHFQSRFFSAPFGRVWEEFGSSFSAVSEQFRGSLGAGSVVLHLEQFESSLGEFWEQFGSSLGAVSVQFQSRFFSDTFEAV